MAHLVPPIILELVKNPLGKNYDLSSLKLVVSGAAPLSENLSESFKKIHNVEVKQGYGLTETSPVVFLTRNNSNVHGSCGILVPNMECKLISDDSKGKKYIYIFFLKKKF
jgi:long-subunit acyl-CoA synthetase (AMP-forming)